MTEWFRRDEKSIKMALGAPFLLTPLTFFVVVGLYLNDHHWKVTYVSWWTGKLSDFLGLFFLPVFLCAGLQIGRSALSFFLKNSDFRSSLKRETIMGCSLLSGIFFIFLQLHPMAPNLFDQGVSLFGFRAYVTQDASDLMALPMVFLSYLYLLPWCERSIS
ncbi:MAG: hypothetical protein AAF203_04025 [Pseudomonadota bacterium]